MKWNEVNAPSTENLTPEDERLLELALYIAHNSQADSNFGATKLNKLLFYCDFLAYVNFGKPLTGVEYFRLENGPAPKRWLVVRGFMIANGDAEVVEEKLYGFAQDKLRPLRAGKPETFTKDELALVKKVLAVHRGKTASDISEGSHDFIGWQLAKDREVIPYPVARLARNFDLTEQEYEHGCSLIDHAETLLAAC